MNWVSDGLSEAVLGPEFPFRSYPCLKRDFRPPSSQVLTRSSPPARRRLSRRKAGQYVGIPAKRANFQPGSVIDPETGMPYPIPALPEKREPVFG